MKVALNDLPGPSEPPEDPSSGLDDNSGEKPNRKRGAPPGNQNARKHGLYSKFLTPAQAEKYEHALEIKDLTREIAIVRLKFDALLDDPEASSDDVLKTVSILSKLITTQRRHFWH